MYYKHQLKLQAMAGLQFLGFFYRNPSGSNTSEVQWPVYNATEQNFFRISAEVPQVLQTSPAQYCDFLAMQFLNETQLSEFKPLMHERLGTNFSADLNLITVSTSTSLESTC